MLVCIPQTGVLTRVCVSQNPGKQGQEIQSSTADLIKGLVQLVPLTNLGEISQEAMEVRRMPGHAVLKVHIS